MFENYQQQLAEATIGNKDAIRTKNDTRSTLTGLLLSLGKDVASVSTSLTMLESSGFALSKTRQATQPLTKPRVVKVKAGLSNGEILFTGKRQKGSRGFVYYITADPQSGRWSTFATTKAKYLFTGLEGSVKHYIKYAITGARDQMVMSDTITYTPQ